MAKIHDLNKQRADKVAEARKLVDENTGDKWTSEIDARWAAIIGEIDGLAAQIDAEIKSEEAAKERAARLAEIEAQARAANGDRRIGLTLANAGKTTWSTRPPISSGVSMLSFAALFAALTATTRKSCGSSAVTGEVWFSPRERRGRQRV